MWETIRWAKVNGAEWFDMGGVTLGANDETALNGISEFKESFSQEVVEVGAEWELELQPVRARFVTLATSGAGLMRELVAKFV
jgi:lipid II:glycine glycyltransferase (peptidoglycan interpeptide bridge formation enzyme)